MAVCVKRLTTSTKGSLLPQDVGEHLSVSPILLSVVQDWDSYLGSSPKQSQIGYTLC